MSNNTQVGSPVGSGDVFTALDISSFAAYPTTGKIPASIIYVGGSTSDAPTPLSNANPLPVSLQNSSIAVTAASLPLPSGAATSTNQATANTSLASIDGKITACNTGAVVIASGSVTADTELTTADLDTGVGTDTRAVVGMVLAASGGGLLVGSANPMPISDNGGSLTIDGTVTANAGTGTFAVSAASLPLPSGAATAAKQPALGTAGTASTDVLSVQGIASMTPLLVNGSGVTQPVSGTVTANQGGAPWSVGGNIASGATDSGNPVKVGGVYNSAAPTFTTGQRGDLQLDSAGRLIVNVGAGGGSGGTSSSFGSAFPATGTAIGASDGTNMHALLVDASGFLKVNVAAGSSGNAAASATGSAVPVDADYAGVNVGGTLRGQTGVSPSLNVYAAQVDLASVAGTTLDTNSGNKSAGTIRVVLATDQPALTNALKVDGSAVTQPVSGTVTVNAGTGTFNNQQSNVQADYDTGAGTQNVTMFGIALPASGGSVAGGTSTNPIQVSLANTAANATAVKVDGSGVTQPVSGTVTANAGTGNFTVVQATASSLNAQVQGAAASGASKAGNPVQMGGVFNTTQPTVTTGQAVELQSTARGAAIVATGVDAFTVTVGAGSNTMGKVDQGAPNASLTNAWPVKVTDGATTMPTGASSATSIHTTVDNATLAVTQSGTFTVGNSAGTAVIGGVVPSAATGSAPVGATPFTLVSAATNNLTTIKASAGVLWEVVAANLNASSVRYLKFYDGNPTMGTTNAIYQIPLPTAGSANGAGAARSWPTGLKFTSGIYVAVTGGIALNDNTAVGANEVAVSGAYA